MATTALSFTYDGEVSPDSFSKYSILTTTKVSPSEEMIVIKSSLTTPKYIIVLVQDFYGRGVVLSYAYLNKNEELKHLVYIDGHYTERLPENPDDMEIIKRMLCDLYDREIN